MTSFISSFWGSAANFANSTHKYWLIYYKTYLIMEITVWQVKDKAYGK